MEATTKMEEMVMRAWNTTPCGLSVSCTAREMVLSQVLSGGGVV